MMTRVLYPALAAAVLAGGGPAAADHLDITTEGLRVEGERVVLPNVRIDMDGYVVIHAVEDGMAVLPGSVGHAAVAAGEHGDVAVPVEGLGAGTYIAMIHYETNGNARYDFGEGMTDVDTPGMRPDGTPYMVEFTLRPM
jgi:hypothetical protein